MLLINPIYDTAFKYLMDDNKAAKVLLSALLKKDVVALTLRRNELASLDNENNIRMTRLDFSAKILNTDGTEELVSIEIQKAQVATEIMRFRNYLGQQYSDESNKQDDGRPLHIIAIYLLGHTIPEFSEPIVYVGPSYTDSNNNTIEMNTPQNEENLMPFIRSLTHDVVVVQIPLLEERPKNYAEEIMSIFDQRYKTDIDSKFIDFLENNKDEGLNAIVSRLRYGASDRTLRRRMDLEREYYEQLQELTSAKQEAEEAKQEADKHRQEAEEAKQEADKHRQEADKNKQEADKNKQEAEKNAQITILAIKALAKTGMPNETIASSLGISEEEVRQALLQ